ncbi:sensor histidine kinase [Sphingomonas psychrotolerans]|uniref:histidine kinase n=1 Tax=Sphingomonas psychrotolerans TaxID=1327635 RepID=A0ABU3N3T8_9SPHN|nr:sensor histidine kinase [Sphingomonas psychrotolerans]MDT8758936.1 sensor histidine kinase [Sphingomonas psychrotolerans]
MGRIGELDLPERLAPFAPAWVTQLLFALLCAAVSIMARALVDIFAPGAGPFALGYPAVLVATLFARWQAGLITGALNLGHAWYFLLPTINSFRLERPEDTPRLVVVVTTYLIMIAIADLFRRAVRRAAAERDRQIAERDLFLEEFDHRVKNNFTLVASLLDMQRRRAGDSETADALANALARVESIARAHRHLYRGTAAPGEVDMATYIHELCTALEEALFLRGAITLTCTADHAALPRDRAVSIGLIVNELVTNAAKHAFGDRADGVINVSFEARPSGWRLTVTDNGGGMSPVAIAKRSSGGLGHRLVEGFVRQARGTIRTDSGPGGTTITVDLAA